VLLFDLAYSRELHLYDDITRNVLILFIISKMAEFVDVHIEIYVRHCLIVDSYTQLLLNCDLITILLEQLEMALLNNTFNGFL